MKTLKLFLLMVGIIANNTQTPAQQNGNGPERFYNVESYKANITLTFQYRFSQSETEYSRLVNVSQSFQHFFTTSAGQISAADMFQVERGDKVKVESADNTSQDGGIMGGMDMDAISQALENSGIETIEHDGKEVNVMDMLNQAKEETESYNMSLDKYKMWMTIPTVGGDVASSIYSKFYDEETGSMHCGEGQGKGSFRSVRNYSGSAQVDAGQSDIINTNGFILLLNLANNSYSFSANVEMPRGFEFKGNTHRSECGTSSDKPLTINARSFINISSEKEGLVYKSPLPGGGMVLSGSEIITDRFNLWGSLNKEGNWTVRIDWTIFPANMDVPEVFISYDDIEAGKKWIPEDKNSLEAKMTWEQQVKPEAIEWTLYNVSAEPGVNLNSKNRDTDFDLSFDLAEVSKGYHLTRTDDGYVIRKEGDVAVGKESVRIQSLDFGAYGQLSGKIKVNGTWWEASHEELGVAWLPVPWDENNNVIADEWEIQVGIYEGSYSALWDEDPKPADQSSNGDGFTLYEEYRGFSETGNELAEAANVQVKDNHVRMDPKYKDVFIYDQDGLFKTHYAPTNAAKLNWHYINFDMVEKSGTLEVDPEYRCVNFNTSRELYLRDQYAIYIVNDRINPDPALPKDGGYNNTHSTCSGIKNYRPAFPLKCVYKVAIYPKGMDNALAGLSESVKTRVKEEILTTTVIHEIGHALGTRHHWDAATETITEQSKTLGFPDCAMRYETDTERSNANSQNFLKTIYCTKGNTWNMPGTDKTISGDDCYGQIDIKGQ